MDSRIILTFNGLLNGSIRVTIPEANVEVTDSEVRDCMEQITSANIFSTIAGTIVSPRSAQLISTTKSDMTL